MPWGNRDYHPLSEPIRFWWNIDYTGSPIGCWIWLGCKVPPNYYGMLNVNGKNRKAHRYAWELTNGPIPEGMSILHKCDNPPCVNPNHLFLGTFKDNKQDSINKNRAFLPDWKGKRNPKSKLSMEQVHEIRDKYASGFYSLRILGKEYGISGVMVGNIVRGDNWK